MGAPCWDFIFRGYNYYNPYIGGKKTFMFPWVVGVQGLGGIKQCKSGWWFFTNPFEKYALVKLGSSSPIFGVKIPKKYLRNATTEWDGPMGSWSVTIVSKFGVETTLCLWNVSNLEGWYIHLLTKYS